MEFKQFLLDTIGNILSNRVKIAAISLDEIVSSKSRLNRNSLNCSTGLLNFSENENTYVYKVVCSEKDSKKDGHKVSVQLQDDPTEVSNKKDLKVKVNCSCEAFLWQGGQFNLHQRDALLGNPRGQLVPPKVRDPVRVNFGCKHVFAAIRKLLDKFKTESPITKEELEEPLGFEKIDQGPLEKSPFSSQISDGAGKKFQPFKDRIVLDKKEVPRTLLPNQVDTSAVEEMDEDTVPTGVTKLFQREEEPSVRSVFRPKKSPLKPDDIEPPKEEEEEIDIPSAGEIPSKPTPYQLIPKHFDEEEEEELDSDEASMIRQKNRNVRKNKVKSLFGADSVE